MIYFKILDDASVVDARQKEMLKIELDLLHWMSGYDFHLLEDTAWGKCLVCRVVCDHGPIDIRGVTTLLHSTAALLIARWTQGNLAGFTGVFTDHEAFAIRYVIDYIQQYPDQASDILIAIVSQLASTALLRNDMDSFEGHMNGLATLVITRGGLSALDGSSELAYIVFRAISRASTVSAALVPPILRDPYHTSGRYPSSHPSKLSFQKLHQQGQITTSLSAICEDILTMDLSGVFPFRSVDTQEKCRESLRLGHQINRVLIALSTIKSYEPMAFRYDGRFPMQETMRLAAKLYVTSIYCREPLTSQHLLSDLTNLRKEIKVLLSTTTYPPSDEVARALFFIISLASALTLSTTGSRPSSGANTPILNEKPARSKEEEEERHWITNRMKDMAQILRIRSWLAAECHLKSFFWKDVSCSSLFKGVWDACMVNGTH